MLFERREFIPVETKFHFIFGQNQRRNIDVLYGRSGDAGARRRRTP
jgi:hypothetical protein